ncbi:DUF4349 domain-containing protein [Paenibacillus sp. Leaf72]|uniref:DUF4349 domain-containing protein n=1 Tax=Paenibacillus sp. Leaf72 TaxID=1736234 RepID=UPI0006FADFC3|nr:DUF4349 domain-containing protein [Paenibacillus sp. Leaf72]KQN97646.1 hypothetical protein ASF12_20795 [Paenibacillus sp. Leaf72]
MTKIEKTKMKETAKEIAKEIAKERSLNKKLILLPTSFLLAIMLLLSACSSANSDYASEGDMSAAQTSSDKLEEQSSSSSKSDGAAGSKEESGALDNKALTSAPADSPIDSMAIGGEAFNQKLIYTATMTMEVADYEAAAQQLRNVLHQAGGYILAFQDGQYGNEKGASYTIKVPAQGFMPFVERLEGIENKHLERELKGTDVTEEYVDLEARLKAKQVVEQRLLAFMDKAEKADDLVKFSQQLAKVQEEIEQIKGRTRYLDKNVAFSTIELRLYQPIDVSVKTDKEEKSLGGKMLSSFKASYEGTWNVLQGLLVFLAGALPALVIPVIIGLIIWWFVRRSRAKTPPAKPEPEQQ